jgi:phospholipase/carboxylesterase
LSGAPPLPEAYGRSLAAVGAASLAALQGLETAQRRLHPPLIPRLRQALGPARDRLEEALDAFPASAAPAGLEAFHAQLAAGAAAALDALRLFLDPGPPHQSVMRLLASFRRHCRAQEAFYPLRGVLPALGRWFVEPAFAGRLAALDPDPAPAVGEGVGLHVAGAQGDPEARGGFSLYVPEWLDGAGPWPLVVALHGGSGHGRDYLWTWLREARGRGFLLLAPTSAGATWSLDAPALDAERLRSMVSWVAERWPVDRARILLTGLSDGATFALLAGLAEGAPYSALAPVSGVLHPANLALGNLERARGRRVYLVHGVLDWLFPVSLARLARDELERAGAALEYREIEDLSHAYPREENDRILAWFDPALALPAGASASEVP